MAAATPCVVHHLTPVTPGDVCASHPGPKERLALAMDAACELEALLGAATTALDDIRAQGIDDPSPLYVLRGLFSRSRILTGAIQSALDDRMERTGRIARVVEDGWY